VDCVGYWWTRRVTFLVTFLAQKVAISRTFSLTSAVRCVMIVAK
jgi:hypothetical protein